MILYDGHCRLCGGAARQLQRWLGKTGTRLLSFREDGVLAAFPGVTEDRCEQALQLVLADGRVVEGLEALVLALGQRPLGRLLRVYYLPGLRQLLDAGYRIVARYRFRIAGRQCPDGTCAVHFK